MFNQLSRRLHHCNEVAGNITKANSAQLQQLKTQLAQQMGKPVGLHTMGIPAAISILGIIISFAIPQLWLGYGVLAFLGQPADAVFTWVVLVALIFAGTNGVTMFMMGKGYMGAVRLHLSLVMISVVLTIAYLLAALSGTGLPGVNVTAALIGVVMILLSISCILSTAFYRMLLFTLHNRTWRRLIDLTRDAHASRKLESRTTTARPCQARVISVSAPPPSPQ
ncbi:hypothetical protein [uncultured Pluralibacter sp.]|uniref:hypothetical protein n=1 Tax=uncultured Pluralibacter sp. TaxID=1490864 RepID=UPI00262C4561|nr:hypothetical protein [uncultured Pluralibacter sp.]